jgi:hypothetical protein
LQEFSEDNPLSNPGFKRRSGGSEKQVVLLRADQCFFNFPTRPHFSAFPSENQGARRKKIDMPQSKKMMPNRFLEWPEVISWAERAPAPDSQNFPETYFMNSAAHLYRNHIELAEVFVKKARGPDPSGKFPDVSHPDRYSAGQAGFRRRKGTAPLLSPTRSCRCQGRVCTEADRETGKNRQIM